MKCSVLVLVLSALGAATGCANEPSAARRRPATRALADAAMPRTNTAPPIDVQAGVGIGPVLIGASRASLASLGFTQRPSSDPHVVHYGPCTVPIGESDAVDWVEFALSLRDVPTWLGAFGCLLIVDTKTLNAVLAALRN